VWSIWPEETGSGGTDAGELQPWRRGWRRRRRTRASRVYSGRGEEEGETADLLDSSASLGEASYGGIGGDQGSSLGRARRAWERNRGREGAHEREDRAEGGIAVEVLSSWRSFGGGVHLLGRSIDGGGATELVVDQRRKTTRKQAGPMVGFGWEGREGEMGQK
jgi:hypothetical protein